MYKRLLSALFILLSAPAFAQRENKDSVIKHIPLIKDKIVYTDSISVNGHSGKQLDSAAKKWFLGNFSRKDSITNATPQVGYNAVSNTGIFEFKCMPGYVNVLFYGIMTIQITCYDNSYTYRISDLYFRPHNNFLNGAGYQRDPNYLIGLYYKKHLSFGEAWNVDRHEIKGYLVGLDAAVRSCIASLNKAMAN